MCMAMDLTERRECVPASSGVNLSLALPTRRVSNLITEIVFEALTKQSPWSVG